MDDDDVRNDMDKLFKILNSAGGGSKPKQKAPVSVSSTVVAWMILFLLACVGSVALGFLGRLVSLGYNLTSKLF